MMAGQGEPAHTSAAPRIAGGAGVPSRAPCVRTGAIQSPGAFARGGGGAGVCVCVFGAWLRRGDWRRVQARTASPRHGWPQTFRAAPPADMHEVPHALHWLACTGAPSPSPHVFSQSALCLPRAPSGASRALCARWRFSSSWPAERAGRSHTPPPRRWRWLCRSVCCARMHAHAASRRHCRRSPSPSRAPGQLRARLLQSQRSRRSECTSWLRAVPRAQNSSRASTSITHTPRCLTATADRLTPVSADAVHMCMRVPSWGMGGGMPCAQAVRLCVDARVCVWAGCTDWHARARARACVCV